MPFTSVTLRKQEIKLLQFNPPGQAARKFDVSKDDANVDSIATALEQQTSGVASKKIVVVDAFCPALMIDAKEQSREDFAASYASKLKRIQEIVQREKAHMQSFTGGRLTITLNAATPTPQAVRRAYIIANELLEEDFELGELTCGIACGTALVGNFRTAAGQHCAVAGRLPETALRLEMMCRSYPGASVLTTDCLLEELRVFALSQYVDIVCLPGRTKPCGILSIVGFKPTGENDEWMYELEGGEKRDPFAVVNSVYEKLLSGEDPNGEAVRGLLQTLPPTSEGGEQTLSLVQLEAILSACRESTSIDPYVSQRHYVLPDE